MLAQITEKLDQVKTVIGTTSAAARNAADVSEELDGQAAALMNSLKRYK